MTNYTVSKDKSSGMWYVHHRNYSYIPVVGSFSERKSDAMEYAKMMNYLPNRVEEIEQRKHEAFERWFAE